MPVKCYRCGKWLCNEQSLFYHLNKKTKCSSLRCTECNVMFKTKLEMRLHKCGRSPVKNVPSPPKITKPEICSKTNRSPPKRTSLQTHESVIPDDDKHKFVYNAASTERLENIKLKKEILNRNLRVFLDSLEYDRKEID